MYRNPDRAVLLDNLFRLRIVAGRYDEAATALEEWRTIWMAGGDTTARAAALNLQYEIYLRAKQGQAGKAGGVRGVAAGSTPLAIPGESDSLPLVILGEMRCRRAKPS